MTGRENLMRAVSLLLPVKKKTNGEKKELQNSAIRLYLPVMVSSAC